MQNLNRDKVEREIDTALELLLFTKQVKVSRGRFGETLEPPLTSFSPVYHAGIGDDDWWIFHPEDVTSPDLVWPIDFSMAWNKCDESGKEYLHMLRVWSAPIQSFRGLTSKFAKHMMHTQFAHVFRDRFYTVRGVTGWQGGRWCDLACPENGEEFNLTTKMLIACSIRRRYQWCVSFGIDDSPKVMIETDPIGLKDLFRDRDKDPERDRRAALRHWVRDHSRRQRKDQEAETFVRRHLRGRTPFKWRGFDCVVEPAPFDLETVAGAKS